LISLWRRIDCRDHAGAERIMASFPYSYRYWVQFLKARIKLGLLAGIPRRGGPYRTNDRERRPDLEE
jgi:hypothetical protein